MRNAECGMKNGGEADDEEDECDRIVDRFARDRVSQKMIAVAGKEEGEEKFFSVIEKESRVAVSERSERRRQHADALFRFGVLVEVEEEGRGEEEREREGD